MKVIATNIFDFTSFYKFGYKSFAKDVVIDLSDVLLTGETLLKKSGFFEEDYELFYLKFKNVLLNPHSALTTISLHDIDSIIPISETGLRMLHTKIPDFKISEPLEPLLFAKLIKARNNFLAKEGGNRILSSFSIEWKSVYQTLQENYIQSLDKYKADLNAAQESVLDQIVFYERSKPFPLSDIGFLYDVGSIAKTCFQLSDEDFKNKSELKNTEPLKYETILQVTELSLFLQSKQGPHVWTPFIEYYNTNNLLKELNSKFSICTGLKINNLLTVAFYLKFRDLIRNTRSLEDYNFTNIIIQHLKKVPEETKVALLLNGLFFGGLKFKELYYKYLPLNISRYKFIKPHEISEKDNNGSSVENESVNSELRKDIIKLDSFQTPSFDSAMWSLLEPSLSMYHSNQIKKIKKCFEEIQKKKGEIFEQENNLFINRLKKEIKKSEPLKEEKNKITVEMVTDIERKIEEILKNSPAVDNN